MAGAKAPVEEEPAEEPESQELEKEGAIARVRRLSLFVASQTKEAAKDAATGFRCSGSIFVKTELTPAAARRVFLLQTLLHWCRNSGRIAVAPLHWQTLEALHGYTQSPDGVKESADESAKLVKLQSKDVAHKVKYALSECGFLFSAYRVDCWYWCVAAALCAFVQVLAPVNHAPYRLRRCRCEGRWLSSSAS